MTATLSQLQVDQYQRDGIVFPIRVFSAEEAAYFRGALELITAHCGEVKRLDSLHFFFDWAHSLVTNDSLLNAVEGLLGSNIVCDGTLVLYKPPRDSSYVTWHQDSVYSGWNLTPSTSAWIALTPSNRANGCMRVIPGSHKEGLLDHDNIRDDPNVLNQRAERVSKVVDEARAVDVVLEPGEISLHHSTIIHGSNPNASDGPRIGFIVRFVTDQTPIRDRQMMRVRGEVDCSHLSLAPAPADTDRQKALSTWRNYSGL